MITWDPPFATEGPQLVKFEGDDADIRDLVVCHELLDAITRGRGDGFMSLRLSEIRVQMIQRLVIGHLRHLENKITYRQNSEPQPVAAAASQRNGGNAE